MNNPYVWRPTPELLENSRVARFMAKHGIPDARELHRLSVERAEWFWDEVVKDLDIPFTKPYEKVLDQSRGIPWCRWFTGGELNVADVCLDRHAAEGSPRRDRPAIVSESEAGVSRTWTYRELAAETNRLANALERLGVAKGDRVGLYMPMRPETVAGFLAIVKLGAIVIPIFSGFGAKAVADRLIDGEAVALITAESYRRKGRLVDMRASADEAVDLSPSVRHVIVLREEGSSSRPLSGRDRDWRELLDGESDVKRSVPADSEHPFMIAYTSGTTGKPKGAVHVHGGFTVKIAQEVAHQVDFGENDILYWFTDMGWIMGPWEVVGGLALGGALFLYDGAPDYPGPDRVWSQIERHRVTILGISPTLIRALMKHGEEPVRSHDLGSLRILGSTGEPWNPDPWMWYFRNVGGGRCPIINFSGGTEVGACFLSPLPISPLKPCGLGGPSLGMATDVLDAEGRSLVGGVGELVCGRPWPGMTRGLWNDPERYLATYWSSRRDVWVHGDWASIDEDGEWFLHGRSDDTLKVSGKRLGPAEVESALVSHPATAEAAAVGVPHDVKGEAVWCFVVPKPGAIPSDALRNELHEAVIESLGKSFAPDRVIFLSELPKTRNGKILRRAIRARALGLHPGDLTNLENADALDAVAEAVRSGLD